MDLTAIKDKIDQIAGLQEQTLKIEEASKKAQRNTAETVKFVINSIVQPLAEDIMGTATHILNKGQTKRFTGFTVTAHVSTSRHFETYITAGVHFEMKDKKGEDFSIQAYHDQVRVEDLDTFIEGITTDNVKAGLVRNGGELSLHHKCLSYPTLGSLYSILGIKVKDDTDILPDAGFRFQPDYAFSVYKENYSGYRTDNYNTKKTLVRSFTLKDYGHNDKTDLRFVAIRAKKVAEWTAKLEKKNLLAVPPVRKEDGTLTFHLAMT